MSLLTRIKTKNFKCFRDLVDVPLNQGTYFIGINNSGKTAVLNAVHFFFDSSLYQDDSFLNRTEYLAKKSDYNKSEITIFFNLFQLKNKAMKVRLVKLLGGEEIYIKKNAVYTPLSGKMSFAYETANQSYGSFEDLDKDIQKLLKSVKISYIHPQEGRELMKRAQDKLRQRLLSKWGLGKTLSRDLKELQTKWDELRHSARNQLSASLTTSIQKMWPGSQASIDLPKNIKDVVGISDISFKGNVAFPEIELISQGTGAQSVILYLAHYLLDSDRSLHQGEYHPIWLLEEPESFLHADLIVKFAKELNSQDWLDNIQMLTSTHSPIILAMSRLGGKSIVWNQIENSVLTQSKSVEKWNEDEILGIGKLMGDDNFQIYFSASIDDKLIFIEDTKKITLQRYEQAGIKVEKGLRGTSEIKKFISVLLSSPSFIRQNIYFIIDADAGLKQFSEYLPAHASNNIDGFKLYKISGSTKLFILALPDGFSVENLFSEFNAHLDNCVSKIWDLASWNIRSSIPKELTRACSEARSKNDINSEDQAKKLIKNHQDVKDSFWIEAEKNKYQFDAALINKIKSLINK